MKQHNNSEPTSRPEAGISKRDKILQRGVFGASVLAAAAGIVLYPSANTDPQQIRPKVEVEQLGQIDAAGDVPSGSYAEHTPGAADAASQNVEQFRIPTMNEKQGPETIPGLVTDTDEFLPLVPSALDGRPGEGADYREFAENHNAQVTDRSSNGSGVSGQ